MLAVAIPAAAPSAALATLAVAAFAILAAGRPRLLVLLRLLAWLLFIAIAFLEMLIQFLQAYVFVLLNAMYISGAVADEH